MYHIISDLETMFPSLAEVEKPDILHPYIPMTAAPGEDTAITRVPAAPTIEQCLTAIGLLGRFRRCLADNEDTYSYAVEGNEVYPILVVELPDELPDGQSWYKPTEEQVPDVERTGEVWSLYPVKPVRSEIKWLSMFSITCDEDDEEICTAVEFETDLVGKDHPWLNFKGHPLESSQMEDEEWDGNIDEPLSTLSQFRFMETRVLRQPVYAIPVDNAYALCYPVDDAATLPGNHVKWPVRTSIKDLRKHTGYYDENGQDIYEDAVVRYNGTNGRVKCLTGSYGIFWFDKEAKEDRFTPFHMMGTINGRLIRSVLID